jgi:hypothetical protein
VNWRPGSGTPKPGAPSQDYGNGQDEEMEQQKAQAKRLKKGAPTKRTPSSPELPAFSGK